jgi:hypothetical protein
VTLAFWQAPHQIFSNAPRHHFQNPPAHQQPLFPNHANRHRRRAGFEPVAGLIPPVRPFDPFPFPVLNQIIAVEAVLMTAFVLMKQNRMSKLAERRAHLNLQINLLTERETTKIIGMLLEIAKRFDIQHEVFDEESRQPSWLLTIETLIETLHSKFPDR